VYVGGGGYLNDWIFSLNYIRVIIGSMY
jgi:hypothetical protein